MADSVSPAFRDRDNWAKSSGNPLVICVQIRTIGESPVSNKTLQHRPVLLRMPKPRATCARSVQHIEEQEIGFH